MVPAPPASPSHLVRVAATADVHAAVDSPGLRREALDGIEQVADVLLIAGDLTCYGEPAEAACLAEQLRGLPVPAVAVLGNHDFHVDRADGVTKEMEAAGVHVLEGSSLVLEVHGERVGVAGVKGFGSGFPGASATEFGEPEIKAFVRHAKEAADRLEQALTSLPTPLRIALLHYSPIEATLEGERREIYPFLGSGFLGDAIDRAGADLVVHGHAHAGSECGTTPGGVPVRNAAIPVIGEPYRVYEVETRHP
jgi:Icc-related predicted phosphoesterase